MMKINYVIKNNVLVEFVDEDTGKNIGDMIYIKEIHVPEGTEIIGSGIFSCSIGSIGKLYIPKSIKMIDSYAFTRREIFEIFYDGSTSKLF